MHLPAQEPSTSIEIFGFENGLSHRNVFKIAQDSTGFLWIATINGLNRFDGLSFRKFMAGSNGFQVPKNYFSDLYIEADQTIWLAYPGGISSFHPESGKINSFLPDSSSILSNQEWRAANFFRISDEFMGCIGQDNLSGSLALMKTNESFQLEDFMTLPNKAAFLPTIFWNNKLVIETFPGKIWLIKGIKIEKAVLDREDARIIDFFAGDDSVLFALLSNGHIYSLNAGEKSFEPYLIPEKNFHAGDFQCFLKEENGDVWLGGYAALWHFHAASKTWLNHHEELRQLVKNTCQIRQIFKDQNGVIWAASDFGLVKITRSRELFKKTLAEGNERCTNGFCSMRGLCEDAEGNIYMSYYNGIHVYNPSENQIRPLFPKNNFSFYPFGLLYHNGNLWTGSGLKINLRNLQIDTLLKTSLTDEGVVALVKNNIWVGYKNQIFQYNHLTSSLQPIPPISSFFEDFQTNITFILPSTSGISVWIGTSNMGLLEVHPKHGILRHIQENSKQGALPSNRILAISNDSKERLWIATANGLACFDPAKNKLASIQSKQGLPNDFINSIILESDTAIWASTDNGLARIALSQPPFSDANAPLKINKINSFFQEDGLTANEFNRISSLKSRTGRFYFGGLNGVISFVPGPEILETRKPGNSSFVLTRFSKYNSSKDTLLIYDQTKPLIHGIHLSPSDRFFTFEFALLDFIHPLKNNYTYLLEGFDNDWSVPSNEHVVRYNNIPSGNYIFRVKASAANGLWNQQEIAIPIYIEKAFYRTWWFLIGSVLLLASGIWGFMRWRIYTLEKREKLLQEEVSNRTEELQIEKQKSEDLLLNILPSDLAEELKLYGKAKARRHELVTVMFTDFKNFTKIAEHMEPEQLVSEIDFCFREFDKIIEKYGLEKIKTIGDAYMCAGGMGSKTPQKAAEDVVAAALEIRDRLFELAAFKKQQKQPHFEARIGIHSGPVVAGIVGIKKFAYDIWGDTVNIASRMETYGESGKVNISQTTQHLVKHHFSCTPQATFMTKNDIAVPMFFVDYLSTSSESPPLKTQKTDH